MYDGQIQPVLILLKQEIYQYRSMMLGKSVLLLVHLCLRLGLNPCSIMQTIFPAQLRRKNYAVPILCRIQ